MKVAVIGHRMVKITPLLSLATSIDVYELVEEGADRFCFAFGGALTDICLDVINELKEYYDIKRVYYRATYTDEKDAVSDYFASFFEKNYFDESVSKTGVDGINERYRFMIDDCDVLLTLYDPQIEKSKTAAAVAYAKKKGKRIINVLDLIKK
ncbi:MAG: hypothetical protein K2N17_06770 [Clostridia bacterium]|nr:hypothetical protein [Clostridia bacterium]